MNSQLAPALNMLEYALALGKAGWRIVPLPPGKKSAPPANWPELATSELAQIEKWWSERPDANIAIVGGNRTMIVDLDLRKPGCVEALAALEAKHGALPVTLSTRTPSGGWHRYFAAPDVPNSSSKLGPGIDIKSLGGYVLAPPSHTIAIKGKQSEGYYQWVDASVPIATAPPWLVELAGAAKVVEVTTAASADAFKLRSIDGEQLADLHSALNHLATVPATADNALWSEIGYSLLLLGDQGRELWCEWSARAPGYTLGAPEQWWDTHKAERTRSDFRHVFTIAQRHGWVNPRSHAAPPQPSASAVAPPPPNRFTPVNAWDYADGPDPAWRVDGLLPEHGLAMIFGASGSGKSFFTLDMAMAIARGTPYGHDKRKVLPGRVVYIAAEGASGFRKRLRAFRLHHQLKPGSPAPQLIVLAPNLMSAADVTELQTAIAAAGGADVIVVDTLHASAAGADENSAKDMGQYLTHCRALQASTGGLVIMIHHSGKDEERGARGSSSLRAAMDTEIEVSGATDSEFRVAHVTKQRDGDDTGAVCFKLVPVALFGDRPGTSAVVEHLPRPAKVRKQRTSAEQALVIRQLQVMSASGMYPSGVQLETLVAGINAERPDMRADNIKRSVTRVIDSGLLTIDKAHNVRLAQGVQA